MSLKCGIVGLPNVGKSTLFNALTKAGIAAENYPFCTIEPNVGIVEVPDPRLARWPRSTSRRSVVPAIVEFVDIAGLVAGASKGEGLGNQFLANIRETDAIVNVVRCFEDPNVIHVAGKVDPVSDIEVIQTELCARRPGHRRERACTATTRRRAPATRSRALVPLLEKCQAALDDQASRCAPSASARKSMACSSRCLLTAKPAMYVANVAETASRTTATSTAEGIRGESRGRRWCRSAPRSRPRSPTWTTRTSTMFLADMGMTEPGLNRLIRAAYALLGLQTYFTAGPEGSARLDHPRRRHRAAGRRRDPHRLRARLHPRRDHRLRRLRRHKGEQGAKEAGKMRLEGKEYVVKDGDVMHFLFNVPKPRNARKRWPRWHLLWPPPSRSPGIWAPSTGP
jgi:GTP-binding protein YchF